MPRGWDQSIVILSSGSWFDFRKTAQCFRKPTVDGIACHWAPVNRIARSYITWNSRDYAVGTTLNRYSLAPEFTTVKLYRKELFSGYMPHDSLLVLFQQDRFTVIERSMQTNTGKRNRQRRMFHMEHVRKMQSLTLHNHILWRDNHESDTSMTRASSA